MPKLTTLEKEELIKLYENKDMDSRQLSDKYGITPSAVIGYLKRNGIERTRFNYGKKYKNVILNHNFFENINTEKASYYAGFIAADGSIYKHPTKPMQKRLVVEIHEKDREILNGFDIGTEMYKRKNRNMISKAISSDKICDDLEKCGIVQNKTFLLKFPTNIDNNNIHHFIRGVFDGDGWFTVSKSGYIRSGFVGCLEFLQGLQRILPCKSILKIPKNKKYAVLTMHQQETVKFANFIYKKATIFLKRKRNIVANYNVEELQTHKT